MRRTAGFATVGVSNRVSATFTRPANATAYTAGDVVSDNATTTTLLEMTGVARRPGESGYITAALLATDLKSITPIFRVHFYNVSTPTVAADNAAHKELYADIGKVAAVPLLLSAMTTPTNTTDSTISQAWDSTIRIPFKCASDSQSLFVLLETTSAFTPASGQSFTLVLNVDLD